MTVHLSIFKLRLDLMATPSPLAQWLMRQISALGETPEQFAARIGINPSGLHKLMRGEHKEVRASTLEKIAWGLGMTPADILKATGKSGNEHGDEVDMRLASMRPVMLRIPRPMWLPWIAASTALADALSSSTSVSDIDTKPVSAASDLDNEGETSFSPYLPKRYPLHRERAGERVTEFIPAILQVSA